MKLFQEHVSCCTVLGVFGNSVLLIWCHAVSCAVDCGILAIVKSSLCVSHVHINL